ncbi:MAG TPA: MFS transporter [Candidatus Binatia bacterium]
MPSPSLDRDAASRRRVLTIALAYVGFVSLGLPDGLLGVATPSILRDFALPPEGIGGLLVAFTAGYLLSSASTGWVLSRMGVGTLLALSCSATSLSLFGYATSPWWSLVLACGVTSGLGAGAIDAGLNAWVASRHGARTVNWLHGFYGIGATAGPLVMTAVLAEGRPWRTGYALVAAAQLVLAAGFAATRASWNDAPTAAEAVRGDALVTTPDEPSDPTSQPDAAQPTSFASATAADTLRRPVVWLSVLLFFLYSGLEASTGLWTYAMLTESRGVAPSVAGTWVGLFWLGLTAGRFGFGVIAGRAPLVTLLRASLAAIALGAALIALDLGDAATLAGLVMCGLAMAPIFPTMIATTPARLGAAHTGNAVGFQIAGATVGTAIVPTLIGFAVGRFGLEAVGPALLAGALLLLALHELVARREAATRGLQPIG